MFRKLKIQKTRPDPNRVLLVLAVCVFLLGWATKGEVENVKGEVETTKELEEGAANEEKQGIIPLENWERNKKVDQEVYKIAGELEELCEKNNNSYEAICWSPTAVKLIEKLDKLGKDALPTSYEIAKDRSRSELLRILMLEGLGASREPGVTMSIVNFLMDKSESEKIRFTAADWLGRIKDTTATTALIRTMGDKSNSSEIRSKAAWALFSIRDKRAIIPLLKVTQTDSDEKVRRAAIGALGSTAYAFGDTSVTPKIVELIKEEKSSSVKSMGYECLGTIGSLGDDRAVSALVGFLNTEGPNYYIINALGISKSYKAKQALKRLLSHGNEGIRFNAAKALLKMGDKSVVSDVEKILSTLESYHRNMISDSLQKFK